MNTSDNAASVDIVIPDIGDAEDVEVIELLVSVGDTVGIDDSLLTLESDKASMEVPSMDAGIIESLSISIGDNVNTGDVIGRITPTNAGVGPTDKPEPDKAPSDAVASPPKTTEAAEAEPKTPKDTPVATGSASTDKPAPSAAKPAAASSPATSPTAHLSDENMRKAHASPGVRRYARDHGADLSLITGTGPKGRIVQTDVMAFIKQSMEAVNSSYGSRRSNVVGGGSGIPPIPEIDFTKFGEIERVEQGRINKLTATNLHRAWLNLPMVTHHDSADVTEMEAFRKQLKAEAAEGEPRVTGLAFHMKTLVRCLKMFPKLNSSLSADGEALIYKRYYHIGIAVDTPNGLVVPVFRDVDKKSIFELATEMTDMSTRARAKKLKPDEMQGASMTISSLGGIGGTAFTPIVNPPEVAILGITRASMQPVWNGTEFIPRLMCPLDLTYDHRVVDGADAARFMASYVREITNHL